MESPVKVMVVEDNALHQRMITKLVQKAFENNVHLSTANTGEQAIEKLKKELPHLMLLDIMLPGISGYEVLEALRKQTDKEIPVIVLSNVPKDIVTDKLLGTNSYYYLSKSENLIQRLPLIVKSAYNIVYEDGIEKPLSQLESVFADLQKALKKQ